MVKMDINASLMAFINGNEWGTLAYLPISHDKPSEYISEVDPLELV